MKNYKKRIKNGLLERSFELEGIFDSETELPWWIEEMWVFKKAFINHQIHVCFLTDRGWENGLKIVSEVLLSENELNNYLDRSSKIASLSMMKGNFEEKLDVFWKELDVYLNKI